MPIAMGAFTDSVPKYFCANWILLCPEKFVLNIYRNETKIFLPQQILLPFKPQNLATGLLYATSLKV